MSTSEAAIGTRTGPRPRKGWPKAKTESPSTSVTVASGGQPEVAVDEDGGHRAAGDERPRAAPSAASPEGTSGPSQWAMQRSRPRVRSRPPSRPGRSAAPKARAGRKRASSRSIRSAGIRPAARSARATGGAAAAPAGLGERRRGVGGDPAHRLDRGDAGDRLAGERPAEGHRPRQPAVEVDRAAAHPRHHPALLEPVAGEPGEDEAGAGARLRITPTTSASKRSGSRPAKTERP